MLRIPNTLAATVMWSSTPGTAPRITVPHILPSTLCLEEQQWDPCKLTITFCLTRLTTVGSAQRLSAPTS